LSFVVDLLFFSSFWLSTALFSRVVFLKACFHLRLLVCFSLSLCVDHVIGFPALLFQPFFCLFAAHLPFTGLFFFFATCVCFSLIFSSYLARLFIIVLSPPPPLTLPNHLSSLSLSFLFLFFIIVISDKSSAFSFSVSTKRKGVFLAVFCISLFSSPFFFRCCCSPLLLIKASA
jgi:hypothetical protein